MRALARKSTKVGKVAALWLLLAPILVPGACAQGATATGPGDPLAHDRQAFDEIDRGHYLATVADCTACHTSRGGKLFAGGLPIETPFGLLLAPNITSDRETGIGSWSDDEFVAAVREGKGRGGLHLYPAMPYTYFARMSRADVLAIRAYLDTQEPVHNAVNANQLPFPFDIRASMIGWNLLFFSPGEFKPVPGKSMEWNQGAYLVEGPGHCGACHTEKNLLGGDKTSKPLQGGELQGWFSPNVTGDPQRGLGHWSVDDVVAYLQTGHNSHAAATGPMSDVITNSTSHLPAADLRAMAVYLKDQPPGEAAATPIAAGDPVMVTGKAIYLDNCAACHAADGTGVAYLFPPVKDNPVVQSAAPATLLQIVLHGTQNVATDAAPTGPSMPAFGWRLSNPQVAAVLTYIRNAWGNAAGAVSADAVATTRERQISEQTVPNPP